MTNSVEGIATSYIKNSLLQLSGNTDDSLIEDEGEELLHLVETDADFAWQVILRVISKVDQMRDIDTSENEVRAQLQLLGAGSIEDILNFNFSMVIGKMAEEVKTNQSLRICLGYVWQRDLGDEDWKQLQALL